MNVYAIIRRDFVQLWLRTENALSHSGHSVCDLAIFLRISPDATSHYFRKSDSEVCIYLFKQFCLLQEFQYLTGSRDKFVTLLHWPRHSIWSMSSKQSAGELRINLYADFQTANKWRPIYGENSVLGVVCIINHFVQTHSPPVATHPKLKHVRLCTLLMTSRFTL